MHQTQKNKQTSKCKSINNQTDHELKNATMGFREEKTAKLQKQLDHTS